MMKPRNTTQEDRVNLRILECLAKHGRMPYAQIAETLKLSANAVRDRILSMERRGVIKSYHAVINGPALGRMVHVLALTEPAPRNPQAFKALADHPNVVSVAESNGRYGLVVELQAESIDAINDILEESLYKFGYDLAEFISLGAPLRQASHAPPPEALKTEKAVAQ